MCGLVRAAGSQFRELFQEIASRIEVDIEELEAIILHLVLAMVSDLQAGHLSDLWACVSEVKLSYLFVRMKILSHSLTTHTVYNAYTYTHTVNL